MRLMLWTMKIGIFSLVVMLISQIQIGEKRICEHVHTMTQSSLVQGPVNWISQKFDHSDGIAKAGHAPTKSSHAASPHEPESLRGRLSGLLKRSDK